MRRCPFRDLAERYPRVVCSMHEGLIDGALEELGSDLAIDRLEPWVEPTHCVATLRERRDWSASVGTSAVSSGESSLTRA
jgi:predicted ArsR family transcriptional regulator